jgi:hypothetical protein
MTEETSSEPAIGDEAQAHAASDTADRDCPTQPFVGEPA